MRTVSVPCQMHSDVVQMKRASNHQFSKFGALSILFHSFRSPSLSSRLCVGSQGIAVPGSLFRHSIWAHQAPTLFMPGRRGLGLGLRVKG